MRNPGSGTVTSPSTCSLPRKQRLSTRYPRLQSTVSTCPGPRSYEEANSVLIFQIYCLGEAAASWNLSKERERSQPVAKDPNRKETRASFP
jgi:hypothetical protein